MEQLRTRYGNARNAYSRVVSNNRPLFDIAIAVAIGLTGLAEARRPGAAAGAVTLAALLTVRRRWPLAIYLTAFALIVAFANDIPVAAFAGVLVAGYTLAAYGRRPLLSFAIMFASALFVTSCSTAT